jgi:hypothetical protein
MAWPYSCKSEPFAETVASSIPEQLHGHEPARLILGPVDRSHGNEARGTSRIALSLATTVFGWRTYNVSNHRQLDDELSSQLMGLGRTTMYRIIAIGLRAWLQSSLDGELPCIESSQLVGLVGSQLCLDCRSSAWRRQPWIPNDRLPLQACCKAQRPIRSRGLNSA